jgi:polysaccharide deacetylase family sporulation protein PdaB
MIIHLKPSFRRVMVLIFIFALGTGFGLAVKPLAQTVTNLVNKRMVPIYKVDTGQKIIAFSFDATWGVENTDELLKILADNGVYTTFFLAGNWIEKNPEYVKRIAEAGHEIGTHSYAHPHFNAMTQEAIRQDLMKNHQLLKNIIQKDPVLFRPPFGEYNNTLLKVAEELGYYTIQWSVDSLDWKDVSADFMVQRVLNNLHPGEIVLFHNAGKNTPEAVRKLLPELKSRGYEIVPIGQLIYRDHYYIEPHTGLQRPKAQTSSESIETSARLPQGAVFKVENAGNLASFAVNVDWGEEYIPVMLDLFQKTGVKVTFFLTCRWALRHPDLVRRMADLGHEIANHGYSHVHPKNLTKAEIIEHIQSCQEQLQQLTLGRATKLYAPPYGEWDERIVNIAWDLGYPTVLWSVDTIDWQNPSQQTIVNRVGPQLTSGAIVLMHPRSNTLAALPELINIAKNKGLKLVSVGSMLQAGKEQE